MCILLNWSVFRTNRLTCHHLRMQWLIIWQRAKPSTLKYIDAITTLHSSCILIDRKHCWVNSFCCVVCSFVFLTVFCEPQLYFSSATVITTSAHPHPLRWSLVEHAVSRYYDPTSCLQTFFFALYEDMKGKVRITIVGFFFVLLHTSLSMRWLPYISRH